MSDTTRTLKAIITGSSASAVKAFEETSLAADESSKGIGSAMDGATTKVGGLFQKLGGMAASLGLPFSESIAKIGESSSEIETKGKSAFQALSTVGGAALAGLGGAAVAAGVEGVKLAEKFTQATGQIASKAGISVAAAKRIGTAFLSTAGTTTFSGQEIATAFAGVAGQLRMIEGHALTSSQALGVMKASMDLAEGSGETLSTATTGLAQVMQAFNIKASGAGKAADEIFNVARATNQPVQGLSAVIARLGGRLGALAPQLSDVGTLMMFPQVAAQGSRGAMIVNTAFTTLLGGSKTVQATLTSLGIHIFNATGKFVGMKSVIGQLQPVLAGMTAQQQMLTEKTLFGSSAAQLMGSIIKGGIPAYDKASAATQKLGTAHAGAEKATANMHDEIKKLKAAVTDLGTKFGEMLVPKIKLAAHAVMGAVTWFEKHKTVAKALAAVIGGGLSIAVAAFAVNMGTKFVKSIGEASKSIDKMVTQGVPKFLRGLHLMGSAQETQTAKVAESCGQQELSLAGLRTAEEEQAVTAEETGEASSAAFGPIGLAVMGVVTVATLLATHWKQVKAVLEAVWNGIKSTAVAVWNGIKGFFSAVWSGIKTIFMDTSIVGILLSHWTQIKSDAVAAWNGIVGFFTGIPGRIVNALGNAGTWLITIGRKAIDGLVNGITGAAGKIGHALIGAVKSGWNEVKGAINSIPVIGGALSAIGLATGGLVTQPTLALVGEAGPELVLPLDQLQAGYAAGIKQLGPGGAAPSSSFSAPSAGVAGGQVVNNYVYAETNADAQDIANEVAWAMRTRLAGAA